jgi:hypothetical protein
MDAKELSRATRRPRDEGQTCIRAAPRLIAASATHLSCAEGERVAGECFRHLTRHRADDPNGERMSRNYRVVRRV